MLHWDNGHMDAGWGVVMMLGMLAFWMLIAFAIVWFVRSTRTPHLPTGAHAPGGPVSEGAEQILAERLARGEIEPEDYQARLTALTAPR
ncbi:MAG: putative rane protein [Frankiales bacterium]|jgi:putative membrane protein|nr:putative rane protein [Frankiales bacterium]MDX6265558.1 putative rane protein [Frankiales bacterium]